MGRSALRFVPGPRLAAAGCAMLGAIAVAVISTGIFPYHTPNHDEAVYLQQASMLLEGQLTLHPPVADAFRPWFFVDAGGALYPKYAPVVAAVFAVGGLLGSFHLSLAVVAGATIWLTYAVVTEAFDAETGVLAAGFALASPLFLVQASVFLPYLPTFCLNLLFAWAYLRADRTGERRFAALAGGAIGLAFFARPYTAVLFALPFVAHALWQFRGFERTVLARHGLTAGLGLVGVILALGYNTLLTGDPLTFPYQAFAPEDGLGFGHRQILGYEREYTLALALEAGGRNLVAYVTRWSVAAPLGVLAALGGIAHVSRIGRWNGRRLAIAGLAVSIPIGELYFWGTLNVLGDLSNPTDGLAYLLGPYYHVGLLLPTAAFGAVGTVAAVRWAGSRLPSIDSRRLRVGAIALCLALVAVLGGVTTIAAAGPLADSTEVTDRYAEAYAPFEDESLEDSLVFLPTPYGEWLNHPFQRLRNDPGFDGTVVYALSTRELAVADAYPGRTLYRYTYRGEWAPTAGRTVTPRLQPVERAEGERVSLNLAADVPDGTELVSIRATSAGGSGAATVTGPRDDVRLDVGIANGSARITSPGTSEAIVVPVDGRSELSVELLVDVGAATSYSYLVDLPVDASGTGITALTPRLGVCTGPLDCEESSAYVPGTHRPGIGLTVDLRGTGSAG